MCDMFFYEWCLDNCCIPGILFGDPGLIKPILCMACLLHVWHAYYVRLDNYSVRTSWGTQVLHYTSIKRALFGDPGLETYYCVWHDFVCITAVYTFVGTQVSHYTRQCATIVVLTAVKSRLTPR